jgi:hypothetical protein
VSTHHSIPGPPEPPSDGHPDFTGYGGPELRRPGIGVDLRNFIILVMIGAVIFGAVRQCDSTSSEQKPQSPSQEKSLSPETPRAQRMASCRTAVERMDKNGALPRDYSINCPYWQWWTHNPEPSRPPPSLPSHTWVLPEPETPRRQVFADPGPPRREREALRTWRDRRDRDWCCCQF